MGNLLIDHGGHGGGHGGAWGVKEPGWGDQSITVDVTGHLRFWHLADGLIYIFISVYTAEQSRVKGLGGSLVILVFKLKTFQFEAPPILHLTDRIIFHQNVMSKHVSQQPLSLFYHVRNAHNKNDFCFFPPVIMHLISLYMEDGHRRLSSGAKTSIYMCFWCLKPQTQRRAPKTMFKMPGILSALQGP